MASLLHSEDGDAPLQPQPQNESCWRSGPLGGIIEAISIVWIVPDYWRLAGITFFGAAGGLVPAIFYVGPLQSQVWGDNASAYASWANAAQFFFAIFGAPLFGKWSDGRARKTSVIIMSIAGFARSVPLLVCGPNNTALVSCAIVTALTGPFVAQLSGSPVMWAWMGDKIPPEHRETGFSLMNGFGSLAVWLAGVFGSKIVTAFHWDNKAYVYGGAVLGVLATILVVTASSDPPRTDVELNGEEPYKGVCTDLISPVKLIARKRSLRLICGIAAFVTLPDVAGTYISSTIVFVLMGVSGAQSQLPGSNCTAHPYPEPGCVYNTMAQGEISLYFNLFPNIFLIPVYFFVGIMAKRFGPAPFLAFFVPFSCIAFAVPAILDINRDDPYFVFTNGGIALEVVSGLAMCVPLAIYPPLSALVTQMVPAHRVGEAMGAVAACKNIASLIAPILMGALLSFMKPSQYIWIFPGGAVLMLLGAGPFSFLLAKRVSQDVDFQWSVWTSVGGSHAKATASGVGASGVQAQAES